MSHVRLGVLARDTLSLFTGVVVAHSRWLHNCDRYTLLPRGLLPSGDMPEGQSFDAPSLEYVEDTDVTPLPLHRPPPEAQVRLGDRVRDRITQIEGRVDCITTFVSGCCRVNVTPAGLGADKKPMKAFGVDEFDLEIVARHEPPAVPRTTGGPMPTIAR